MFRGPESSRNRRRQHEFSAYDRGDGERRLSWSSVFGPAAPTSPQKPWKSALARAYQGNPQLNAQRAIVRQNDEGVPQALSGYRPTLSATASVGEQYTNRRGVFPPVPPQSAQRPRLHRQGLHHAAFGRRQRRANVVQRSADRQQVRKAESQVSAARETLRVMEESVLLSAATAYMDVSRDTANLEVQQNNVRVLQRTLKDTRNRFTAGQVTPTDVAQAEAQLAAGEASFACGGVDADDDARPIIGASSASSRPILRPPRRSIGWRRRR